MRKVLVPHRTQALERTLKSMWQKVSVIQVSVNIFQGGGDAQWRGKRHGVVMMTLWFRYKISSFQSFKCRILLISRKHWIFKETQIKPGMKVHSGPRRQSDRSLYVLG